VSALPPHDLGPAAADTDAATRGSVMADRPDDRSREQRGVNHAAAAVRVLERRIARLEAAVFPHEQRINRSRPPRATEVRNEGESDVRNRTD
jgi:hypothetical protein